MSFFTRSLASHLGEGQNWLVRFKVGVLGTPASENVFAADAEAAADIITERYPGALIESVEAAQMPAEPSKLPSGRKLSFIALGGIGGAVAGVKLWPKHPVWGGIIGFVAGGHVGKVIVG